MSNFSNKSGINIEAAKLLHNKGYYPSVVHCAYYGCYQLMAHIWFDVVGKSENELMTAKTMNEGSHEVLINQITQLLSEINEDSRTFNNSIGILKKIRVKADYKDVEINHELSTKSIDLANTILRLVKSCK